MGKLEVHKILTVEVWANFRENVGFYYKYNLRRVAMGFATCVAIPFAIYKFTAADVVRSEEGCCLFAGGSVTLPCRPQWTELLAEKNTLGVTFRTTSPHLAKVARTRAALDEWARQRRPPRNGGCKICTFI